MLKTPAQLHADVAATKDLVTQEQIHHMRVLWKKGRNMFASFLTEAETVKQRIGNDELFATWCFWQLHIGMSAITGIAVVMKQDDADRIKAEFAGAKKAEKDKKDAEAHAAKLKKIAMDNEIAEEKAKNALLKAAQEKAEAEQALAARRAAGKQRDAAKASKHDLTDAQKQDAAHRYFDLGENKTAVSQAVLNTKSSRVSNRLEAFLATEEVYRATATQNKAGKSKARPSKEADEATLYKNYVEAGKKAANHQWELGDLAIKVTALPSYGEAKLENFADDIGVECGALRRYRDVAKAWPENAPRGANWSVARELATHPNRVALVKADPHMRVAEARETMRVYKASNVINLRAS